MKKITLLMIVLITILISGEVFSQTVSFETGTLNVSLHKLFGRLRFTVPTSTGARVIDRTGILVGTAIDKVFDYKNDYDVVDTPYIVTNPTKSDFEIYGSFGNAYSGAPPDILSKWNVYGWNNKAFVIVKFELKNQEATPMNATVGLETVTQTMGGYGNDTADYLNDKKFVYIYNGSGTVAGNIGIKWLSREISTNKNIEYFANYWIGDTLLYQSITAGTIESRYINPGLGEPTVNFLGQPAVNINSGQSTVVYVAYAFAGTKDSVVQLMEQAQQKYLTLTSIKNENSIIPRTIELKQNYPNPFNPATTITYSIPVDGTVNLSVFDVLGKKVAELVNDIKPAGEYQAQFDGNSLPSGLYFYKLETAGKNLIRKMVLIK